MAEDRLKIWETLFARALELIDSATRSAQAPFDWSFGGGTVLMLQYHHRFSKDIDIFLPDPQYLGLLTPRLSSHAEQLTSNYVEQANSLKLFFPEGEIDFVASAPLTQNPTRAQTLLSREIAVETATEIIAKKIWQRGDQFTARDIFDLALVAEKEPGALREIRPILRDRRDVILEKIASNEAALRDAFAALEILEFKRSFDECVELARRAFMGNR